MIKETDEVRQRLLNMYNNQIEETRAALKRGRREGAHAVYDAVMQAMNNSRGVRVTSFKWLDVEEIISSLENS